MEIGAVDPVEHVRHPLEIRSVRYTLHLDTLDTSVGIVGLHRYLD